MQSNPKNPTTFRSGSVKVKTINWKKGFKQDINNKLAFATKEYNSYTLTDNVIFLQQAGNKLFSAVENYLMIKYNHRVKSYAQILQLVKNNKNDTVLLIQAVQLHYFFYNADLYSDRYTIEIVFKIVMSKMKSRMEKK